MINWWLEFGVLINQMRLLQLDEQDTQWRSKFMQQISDDVAKIKTSWL